MKLTNKKIISFSLTAMMFLSGCGLQNSTQTKGELSQTTDTKVSGAPEVTTTADTTSTQTLVETTSTETTSTETTSTETTSTETTSTETTTTETTSTETTSTTESTGTSSDTGTSSGTKTEGSKPEDTSAMDTKPLNPINPDDIKSGDAYDTATVRDWIKRGKEADYFPDKKLVFLTFDDGPSGNVTPKVLDVLKKNNVHGTFFYYTYGDLSSRADLVRRTADEGHAIAIHTASHDYKKLYPKRKANTEAVVKDAQRATKNVQDILGTSWQPSVYRFPGGSFSWTGTKTARKAMEDTKAALSDIGLEYIDWNALSGDSDLNNKDKSVDGLVKYTIKTTKQAPGYIIVLLMHDAGHLPNSPKALQGIIDYYKENGYEFGILK